MKELNNNEVDALLRSLAKREADSPARPESGAGNMNVRDHLDADELSSYAEGVVPAPARTRYTEHLAECDSCRRIVVSLSQSAGPVSLIAPEPRAESNFWQKLSALFSPMVLRFAVPALMLTIVIGIGFLVMRQQRQSEFIAQNKIQDQPAAPTTALNQTEAEKLPDAKAQPSSSGATEPSTGGLTRPELEERQNRPVTQPPPTSIDTMAAKAPAAKDEAKAGEGADANLAPTYSMQPKAAPAPPPASTMHADKGAELAKEAPAKREDDSTRRDGFIQREEEHGPQRSRSNTTGTVAGVGRNSNLMSNRGPSDAAKNKAYVETRSVAGRYFTREGNAWIDTEYDPARATIRVARGSDQFRALVADEPGIRTISEQLGGVVIVVWKGRAYRIQ